MSYTPNNSPIQVIKQEFLSRNTGQLNLVRVSYHAKAHSSELGLTQLAPALTGNDLCLLGLNQSDLIVTSTIVHCQGTCDCKECSPVWASLDREYVFD